MFSSGGGGGSAVRVLPDNQPTVWAMHRGQVRQLNLRRELHTTVKNVLSVAKMTFSIREATADMLRMSVGGEQLAHSDPISKLLTTTEERPAVIEVEGVVQMDVFVSFQDNVRKISLKSNELATDLKQRIVAEYGIKVPAAALSLMLNGVTVRADTRILELPSRGMRESCPILVDASSTDGLPSSTHSGSATAPKEVGKKASAPPRVPPPPVPQLHPPTQRPWSTKTMEDLATSHTKNTRELPRSMGLPDANELPSSPSFSTLRHDGQKYVDKTQYINPLLKGRRFLLARPRGFGKSVMISMLDAFFRNKWYLFQGLAVAESPPSLENGEVWSAATPPFPVILVPMTLLSYAGGAHAFESALLDRMRAIATNYNVRLKARKMKEAVVELIEALANHPNNPWGRVVVLVEDYDVPVVSMTQSIPGDEPEFRAGLLQGDTIQRSERRVMEAQSAVARGNYLVLTQFLEALAYADNYIRLLMLCGRTDIAAHGSPIPDLRNITVDGVFSDSCGFSWEECQQTFQPEIGALSQKFNVAEELLEITIERWFGGYMFGGPQAVLSPLSVISLLRSGEFRPHALSTAVPQRRTVMAAIRPRHVVTIAAGRRVALTELSQAWIDHLFYRSNSFGTDIPKLEQPALTAAAASQANAAAAAAAAEQSSASASAPIQPATSASPVPVSLQTMFTQPPISERPESRSERPSSSGSKVISPPGTTGRSAAAKLVQALEAAEHGNSAGETSTSSSSKPHKSKKWDTWGRGRKHRASSLSVAELEQALSPPSKPVAVAAHAVASTTALAYVQPQPIYTSSMSSTPERSISSSSNDFAGLDAYEGVYRPDDLDDNGAEDDADTRLTVWLWHNGLCTASRVDRSQFGTWADMQTRVPNREAWHILAPLIIQALSGASATDVGSRFLELRAHCNENKMVAFIDAISRKLRICQHMNPNSEMLFEVYFLSMVIMMASYQGMMCGGLDPDRIDDCRDVWVQLPKVLCFIKIARISVQDELNDVDGLKASRIAQAGVQQMFADRSYEAGIRDSQRQQTTPRELVALAVVLSEARRTVSMIGGEVFVIAGNGQGARQRLSCPLRIPTPVAPPACQSLDKSWLAVILLNSEV